jgi:hypothetical protein
VPGLSAIADVLAGVAAAGAANRWRAAA